MNNILAQLKLLIETAIANPLSPLKDIKRVIIGDPLQIPESTNTCILVKPISQEQEIRGNVLERILSDIEICVIVDGKQYLKNEITLSDTSVLNTCDIVNKLLVNNESDPLALVGLLQKNPRLNNSCHDQRIIAISYDIKERTTDGKYQLASIKIRCSIIANRPL